MVLNDLRCGLCGASSFERIVRFKEYKTSILLCRKCGLMVNHPLPAQDKIYERYQADFYSSEGKRFKGWVENLSRLFRVRRAGLFHKRFGPRGVLLDVGCGRGIMLNELKKRGWSASGTQVSKTAAEHIKKGYGIDCFIGELPLSPFLQNSFDIITMYHVLEHLADPFLYLNCCKKLLKPGGYLFVEVPNADSWSAKVTKDAWMGWDPLHHLYHFTPSTLSLSIKKAGFVPVEWSHFSWEYGPFTTLQSLLNLSGIRDALFSVLKINPYLSTYGKKSAKDTLLVFYMALLLAAPALLFSTISSAFKHGEIIRVLAKAQK
ncbi:MAG: class I SAM-dependent methyltransferase [bacterium]